MKKSSIFPKVASRCETCHGAGVLPGRCREDELLPCPTCKGKGVIAHTVTKKRVEERPCDNPDCRNGRVIRVQMVDGREVQHEVTCPVCEGYGVIYRETKEITTESEKCPTCGGKAVLTAGEMRRRKLECFCPDCHGTGFQLAEEPAKKAALFGVCALVYPAVTLVGMAFRLMLKGVKAFLFTKTPKAPKQPEEPQNEQVLINN